MSKVIFFADVRGKVVDVDVEGLLKGIYRYSPAPAVEGGGIKANILASGTGMQWALKAQQLLAQDWG
ncbi:MAG TPA: hypothetical protein VK659_16755, partial [Asanoa sp.]|nr:hypothetical protein [Asanoa sp.]